MMLPLFERLCNHRPGSQQMRSGLYCRLAKADGKADISHRLSTATRNLIAFFSYRASMTDEDERELQAELARLQQEHRDLDAAIDALHQSPAPDLLRLQRMKKRKLLLRDRIAFIEDQITPDIIA
jgi:hypothetical protein